MKTSTIAIAAVAAGGLLLMGRANAATATGTGAGAAVTDTGGMGSSGGAGSATGGLGAALNGFFDSITKLVGGVKLPTATATTSTSGGDPIKDAYLAGNYSTLNQLLSAGGVTAAKAAATYGLPDSSLVTMRGNGVVFAADPVTQAASAGATTTAAPNWAAITAGYNAHDVTAVNAQLKSAGVTADEAAAHYGLNAAFVKQLTDAGVSFA